MYDIIIKKCKNCGKEFMLDHSRQLYCTEQCKKDFKKTRKPNIIDKDGLFCLSKTDDKLTTTQMKNK